MKPYYFLNIDTKIYESVGVDTYRKQRLKNIGNYFESESEAKLGVKLLEIIFKARMQGITISNLIDIIENEIAIHNTNEIPVIDSFD